jgi:hypothetical protein
LIVQKWKNQVALLYEHFLNLKLDLVISRCFQERDVLRWREGKLIEVKHAEPA